MRNIIATLVVLLSINLAHSQQRVNVTLTNGEKITGKGSVTKSGVNLKTSNGTRKIDASEIDRVTETKKKRVKKYAFRRLREKGKLKKLELSYSGDGIELFKVVVGKSNQAAGPVGVSVTVIRYYVYREGETFATMVSSGAVLGKSFTKRAKEYFADCPELTSKLGKKGFKKENLIRVVKYYEKNCGV